MSSKKVNASQSEMLAEFESHHETSPIKFKPLEATTIIVPKHSNESSPKVYSLPIDAGHEYKLIFSAMYTANFCVNTLRKESNSYNKALIYIVDRLFIFLQKNPIQADERTMLLKHFEAFRVEVDLVKPQSTGLNDIKSLLKIALYYKDFVSSLSLSDSNFLLGLSKTRLSAKEDSEQTTLTGYIAFHSWLRREDIGVGAALFDRSASVVSLMQSFELTTSASLIEIHKTKHELIMLFKSHKRLSKCLPKFELQRPSPYDYEGGIKNEKFRSHEANYKVQLLNYKKEFFNQLYQIVKDVSQNAYIQIALDSLFYAECPIASIANVREHFWSGKVISTQIARKTSFNQLVGPRFCFSIEFIIQLAEYATQGGAIPVSYSEKYLFTQLMAYQTVSSEDIFKLRLSNFKFIKSRVGGIKFIVSDYFKSRARAVHNLNTLDTKLPLGKAVECYLFDITNGFTNTEEYLVQKAVVFQPHSGKNSVGSVFYVFLSTSNFRLKLDDYFKKNNYSPVFLECMRAITSYGIRKTGFKGNWELECETPTLTRLLSLSAIKNSRIHADTGNADPSHLLTYRSHSAATERKYYLSSANEEYENNCGRITRLVMNDLQLNVFRPSKQDIHFFNKKYEEAASIVTQRAEHVLMRLKVIISDMDGKVDNLGFVQDFNFDDDINLPDQLYILDSPETVMKLKHYLYQLHISHKRLFERSIEYLFYEALPTAEWIEALFNQRAFSNESLTKGEELFAMFKNDLPPLFSVYTGEA